MHVTSSLPRGLFHAILSLLSPSKKYELYFGAGLLIVGQSSGHIAGFCSLLPSAILVLGSLLWRCLLLFFSKEVVERVQFHFGQPLGQFHHKEVAEFKVSNNLGTYMI